MNPALQRFREKFGTEDGKDWNHETSIHIGAVESFLLEVDQEAYQRGRENAYSDRETLPSETLHAQGVKEAYQRGKEEVVASLPKHEGSLHITHNQHKNYYEAIEAYIADREIADYEWATPTSKERALATNSLWEVQWYPDTPVGFCIKYGATLEEILSSLTTLTEEK